MKKESPRSLRLTTEALAALKVLSCETPGKSQGDIVSEALVEKANKSSTAPVIRFGIIDPQQIPQLQLEAALAERRLRELKQQVLRIRPQHKTEVEKLSGVLGKVEAELEKTNKLRIALANLARLGNELTAADQAKARTLINWVLKRIEIPKNAESKSLYELELRILKAFLVEE